jgi:hypothetical protein
MVLRPLLPWLLLALAMSVAAMVLGAGRGDKLIAALASGLYAAAIVAVALWINAPFWSRTPAPEETSAKTAIAGNVWLAALVYAWGAAALLAVYSLSGLTWRHGWQYGLGAAIISAGFAIFAATLDRQDIRTPSIALTALHGVIAGGGLGYLIFSGKLATLRSDWAANDVFLAGGLAVVALCIVAAVTQSRNGTQRS